MGKVTGKFAELYFDGQITGRVTAINLGSEGNVVDGADHDTGGHSDDFCGIIKDTCTVNCFYDDQDTNQKDLRGYVGSDDTKVIAYRPTGTGTGKTEFASNARVLGWKMGAPINGMETIDFTFGMSGAWVEAAQA